VGRAPRDDVEHDAVGGADGQADGSGIGHGGIIVPPIAPARTGRRSGVSDI
jgi:hypothetical protein